MEAGMELDDDRRSDSDWSQARRAGESRRRWQRPAWLSDSGDESEGSSRVEQRVRRPFDDGRDGSDSDEIMAPASPSHREQQRPGPSKEELAVIDAAIVNCYREVWREFYEWEPQDSLQTLQSLSAMTTPQRPLYDLTDGDWSIRPDEDANDQTMGQDSQRSREAGFEVYEWDSDGVMSEYSVVPSATRSRSSAADPHPRYEACDPLYCCVDPEIQQLQLVCRFIKYAGQPGFDEVGYMKLFHSIAWQQPWRDPDREFLQVHQASP